MVSNQSPAASAATALCREFGLAGRGEDHASRALRLRQDSATTDEIVRINCAMSTGLRSTTAPEIASSAIVS